MVKTRWRVPVEASRVSRSTPNTCTMPVGGKSSGGIKDVSSVRVGWGRRGSFKEARLNYRFKPVTCPTHCTLALWRGSGTSRDSPTV